MKERFKFRAWNLEKGIMHYNAEDTYDGISENGIEHSNFSAVLEDNEYIVMQSTGLKDRNGKLIYEGDILKVVGKQTEEIIGCVQWLDDFCKFSLNIANSKEGKYQSCETFCEFDYLPETEREIIGNIYENKELLEEQSGNKN